LPDTSNPLLGNPDKTLLLTHENGISVSNAVAKVYKNQIEHDPSDIGRARELVSLEDQVPVGILYRNKNTPCYEDIRRLKRTLTTSGQRAVLNEEIDKFSINMDPTAAVLRQTAR
jgi:2-oxoglutarate ferredoxin oxidoreductase subunit beta